MAFKEFFDESTTASSVRLFSFILILMGIVNAMSIIALAFVLSYLKPEYNVDAKMLIPNDNPDKAMSALLWSEGILLSTAFGGKVVQKKFENGNMDIDITPKV